MQIVIDIPEQWEKCNIRFIRERIRNGTPLPKGHGRLIDADALKAVLPIYVFRNEQGHFCKISDIDKIPPFAVVIEADKEEQANDE